jgi:hypothetical protein
LLNEALARHDPALLGRVDYDTEAGWLFAYCANETDARAPAAMIRTLL